MTISLKQGTVEYNSITKNDNYYDLHKTSRFLQFPIALTGLSHAFTLVPEPKHQY